MPAVNRSVPVSGFTLVELLSVVLLIAVLAGLIIGAAVWAQKKSLVSRAQVDIKLLELAIENFNLDNGFYPTSGMSRCSYNYLSEQDNSKALYGQLVPKYLNPPSHMVKSYTYYSVTHTYLIDPFGIPYVYYNPVTNIPPPVKRNKASYDLLSYGPNRVTFVDTSATSGETNSIWWIFSGYNNQQATGWGAGSPQVLPESALDDITNYQ